MQAAQHELVDGEKLSVMVPAMVLVLLQVYAAPEVLTGRYSSSVSARFCLCVGHTPTIGCKHCNTWGFCYRRAGVLENPGNRWPSSSRKNESWIG